MTNKINHIYVKLASTLDGSPSSIKDIREAIASKSISKIFERLYFQSICS